MKELLGKPTGFVVDLKHAGSLVLDLCKFGFATIQEEGMHYEISEEAKRLMFQTVQNRREEDVVTDAINDLTKRFKDRNKKKKDEKFLHNLVNLPHEECSDQILRAVLESKNLEGRAEVWEGKEGTRLRLYFAFYGEEAGGKSWDPKGDSSIHGLSETWNDEDGAVGFLLHFASHPRLQNQKIQGDFARVLSGDSEMEKFAMYARLHYWYLKFKLLGSTGGPVKN
jgi:hypothetical protein